MSLVLAHARARVVELFRYPAYSVPVLLFPVTLFMVVVAFRADDAQATRLTASFCGLAVLSVALFDFGVGIAAERVTPWERFLRILPAPPGTRFASRVLAALAFALPAAGAVAVAGALTTPADLGLARVASLALALVVGAVPLALLGIALGYWLTPKGALPTSNLLFLGMAFAGGLWAPPEQLPHVVSAVSVVLPTRQFGELLWASVELEPPGLPTVGILGAYCLAFGALAWWGYRRDEGERFT